MYRLATKHTEKMNQRQFRKRSVIAVLPACKVAKDTQLLTAVGNEWTFTFSEFQCVPK